VNPPSQASEAPASDATESPTSDATESAPVESATAEAPQPEAPAPKRAKAPAEPKASSRYRDDCGLLRDYWYVACTAAELKAGAVLPRLVLEEALVVWRDSGGEPVAFRDRCLHRNAELSEGVLTDGCLRCPYHGWTFDPEGRCVAIPSAGPENTVLPKKRLVRFPAREAHGLIWVWMGDPDEITREPFPIPYWNENGYRAYFMITMFENDVTNCAENFMDVPHTVYVHDKWFRNKALKKVPATVERTEDSVLVTYHQENDTIGFSGWILNPSGEPMVHTDKFYMPNVTRVDYTFGEKRGFIITSQCTPETATRTRVYTAITYKLGNPLFNAVGAWFLPPYTRKVIHQDVVIMANQGRSLRRYGEEFLNSEADLLHRYIESLRNWAEAGGTGPKPKPTKQDIVFWI
jgi:phenylpropionate dioxygenase-like ring-hydroxylating dioxygenase large terminal subunit